MAESAHEKFRKLLAELFMSDRADLDFGIYRIVNAKRDEVTRFFDNDLLPQVKATLSEVDSGQRAQLQSELEEAEKAAGLAGFDADDSPRVQDLRQALKAGGDPEVLEAEIFSNLYSFFRRYYKDGDFISLRRYKEGVYAIPYEGEEVKLYWANHDQYYIKSGEYFRNYAFKLPDGRRVHFKLVQADEERDSTKAAAGQERRFILSESEAVREEDGELVIPFEYRPDQQKRKRDELVAQAAESILADAAAAAWLFGLAAAAPTEKNRKRTLLERHLNEYTARNSFDYFIHKDLGGFLRRELDFYIKNEVMHLDDIESEGEQRVIQYLAKIKAIRRIAHKIIDFLAQLEDFQKKLWLKKKFVVEANYCVTLDRVPEELYPEIAANEAQREEWVRLFAIDEIQGDLTQPGYSAPLTLGFLKANPFLVLDTLFFGLEFRDALLSTFDDLDEQTDGLLVHGDNLQALRLLKARLASQVDCVYIDPPYNTGNDDFLYRDSYQHSSWLCMMAGLMSETRNILSPEGVFFCSIDSNEYTRLSALLADYFGQQNWVGDLVWRASRENNPTQVAMEHEYVPVYAKDRSICKAVWKSESSPAKELLLGEYQRLKASRLPVPEIQEALREFIRSNKAALAEVDRYKYVDEKGVFTGSQSVHNPHPGGYDYEILHPDTGKPMRKPSNCYRFPPETMDAFKESGRLIYGPDEKRIVQLRLNLEDFRSTFRSVVDLDSRLGAYAVRDLFGATESVFGNPKPPQLLASLISFDDVRLVMDFFAGSGTTGHSAIQLNREDGRRRKYVLVEVGDHFDAVLRPRICKAAYSAEWKGGMPLGREGLSQLAKYVRLESYEDALNNLSLRRTDDQDQLLAQHSDMREDYTLRYMLDVESEGSASLLELDQFEDPFSYTLQIGQGSVGETRPVTVDLVETFNYLIGLRVRHVDSIRGFKVVEGASPRGERVLVIWRNTRETSNADLDDFFQKQGYNTRDTEFDVIYVNGDNNLENLRRPDETWKVRLIEDDFKRLMFDVEDA